MRHYHGTPLGGTRDSVARFIASGRRCFLVPYPRPEDLPIIADSSAGFILDNGAFSAWKSGKPITDWSGYYQWCREWHQHPRFDFAIIPDVIDGSEADNDSLIIEWHKRTRVNGIGWIDGAPVWHLHESLERLERIIGHCRVLCLGSSGDYATIGTESWNRRMAEAMSVLCDSDGRPRVKIHGLRMLDRDVVGRYPFYSADSTNVAQNSQLTKRYGMYSPPTQAQRREVLASIIESVVSPAVWVADEATEPLFSLEAR